MNEPSRHPPARQHPSTATFLRIEVHAPPGAAAGLIALAAPDRSGRSSVTLDDPTLAGLLGESRPGLFFRSLYMEASLRLQRADQPGQETRG